MSLAFDAMLNQVPASVVQSINKGLIQFITRYRSDSNLLGHGLWDENFSKQISIEPHFFLLRMHTIFKKTKLIEDCNTNFAKCNEWDLYPYV